MDEILYAGIANARQAAALNLAYMLLAAERQALPNHPALQAAWKLLQPGESTTTVNLPFIGMDGYNRLSPIGEGISIPNTALTTATAQVSVGRYGLRYSASDMARATDGVGILNTGRMALSSIKAKAATLIYLLMSIVDDFTATAGTPGAVLTIPQYQTGVYTLDALSIPGPYLATLAGKQWKDLQAYMTANAGAAMQYHGAAARVIDLNGKGAKGELLGADVFVSNLNQTKNAGVDVAGGVFGLGGVAVAEAQIANDGDPNALFLGMAEEDANGQPAPGRLVIERKRDADTGVTGWVTSALLGMSLGRDAHGLSWITAA